jgi:hypothetical protein
MNISRLLVSLGILAVTGCGGNSGDESHVRVFHASPDAPNVDVYVDGGVVLENVPYTAASDFLGVDAGSRKITVTPTGSKTAVIDAQLELVKDTDYMIVASGKVAQIAPIVTTVDRSEPEDGNVRVRVLHAAPNAPSVDVYVTAPGTRIAGVTPTLANVPFKAISDYLTVPAGTYDVTVTVAGTKNVAIQALNLELTNQLVATVAALDKVGGGAPFSLQVLDER